MTPTAIIAYSLDDPICFGYRRRIDRIGQDSETGELLIVKGKRIFPLQDFILSRAGVK